MNVRKLISVILTAALAISLMPVISALAEDNLQIISYNYCLDSQSRSYNAADTKTRKMEKLGRGLVAVKTSKGVYLSWRLFDSEDTIYGSAENDVYFNVYRDGVKITGTPVKNSTNYTDAEIGKKYSVAPVINGTEGKKCSEVTVLNNNYFDIPIQKPENLILADGNTYSYTANDASCGDFDGDGEYEIVLKWDCNGQDNSHNGYTGNVLLDAYKLDGTRLWRIDLGQNIRAGAHYTQFLVYDFDGDGKAEMTCKTSAGSKDSKGNYVSKASLDSSINSLTDSDNEVNYIDGGGRPQNEPEFYTIFDCNGIAMDTIKYPFGRYEGGIWGYDSNGKEDLGYNRSERFLGAVAYLDGETPAAVTIRGYYDRTTAAVYTVENNRLQLAASTNIPSKALYSGQGNHNVTVADVDNDGEDEIIIGSLCWNGNLLIKWCSGRGHGDALHIGDYDPTNPGLEYFSVHESGGYTITSSTTASQGQTADYGMTVYRAATGEELFHEGASGDTGRGCMASVGMGGYYQFWSSGNELQIANGNNSFTRGSKGDISTNFRVFWDGDLYDELLDGVKLTNWNSDAKAMQREVLPTNGKFGSINGTKSNPALQADLFGDWREELVYPTTDGNNLRVFTTTTTTNYKIKTLMHDPVYRSGVAAEQTAYNQPPHVGFYMGEEMFEPDVTGIEISSLPDTTEYFIEEEFNSAGLTVLAKYDDGTTKEISSYEIYGFDSSFIGEKTITIMYMGYTAEFKVTIKEPSLNELNGTYETASTQGAIAKKADIGIFTGDFMIEHTVTINSMPANGATGRNDTSGFFVRFNPTDGTGGGWYLTANADGTANVMWKSTDASAVTTTPLNIGETYTFKYEFSNVGDGTGASVKLLITDALGNEAASTDKLSLRNMSYDKQMKSPLGGVEIYNQAKSGSTASVTFDNAVLHTTYICKDGKSAVVKNPDALKLYAAKYSDNVLERVTIISPDEGKNSLENIGFEPDKVFIWTNDMSPVCVWEK